uniref:Uncharacterized protein n=1 Tax=Trichormus variabilis (strain ATCC 29413 / PCC 7937) TaxID=240292 RepID=R9WTJ8_TRIV2|nr:hypothetical protein AvaD_0013 [Trichormus variabilis ATCC 29413]
MLAFAPNAIVVPPIASNLQTGMMLHTFMYICYIQRVFKPFVKHLFLTGITCVYLKCTIVFLKLKVLIKLFNFIINNDAYISNFFSFLPTKAMVL